MIKIISIFVMFQRNMDKWQPCPHYLRRSGYTQAGASLWQADGQARRGREIFTATVLPRNPHMCSAPEYLLQGLIFRILIFVPNPDNYRGRD